MIRVENLFYRYDADLPDALRGISLDIEEGLHTVLIGPNGCGKTTLVKHLNALLFPLSGWVSVDGMITTDAGSVREIRRRVGMVFQNPESQIVGMTVEEDVAFGPGNLALPSAEIRRRVDESLRTVGLNGFEKRAPHTLSGGEKRLLSIAGALAMNPRYIIMDEPTAYLDPSSKRRVLEIIRQMNRAGMAVIHIAHSLRDAARADRVAVMERGRLLLTGSPEEVFLNRDLLASIDFDDLPREAVTVIRLGEYRSGNSLIHRLDPRVKILSVVVLSVLIFGATSREIALISGFLAALFIVLRLTPAQALRTLRPVALFMGLIFIAHLLFTEGSPILSLTPLPIRITQEGFVRGLYVTWQFAAMVLAAAVLTRTTSPSDLVAGIGRLLSPLSLMGMPSQDLTLMIAMAFRFMPMLLEEHDRIRTAQTARGADLAAGSLSSRLRAGSTLIVPLMDSAFRRADELAEAMEARGYRREPATTLRELAFTRRDWAASAAMAAFLLVNIAFRMAIR